VASTLRPDDRPELGLKTCDLIGQCSDVLFRYHPHYFDRYDSTTGRKSRGHNRAFLNADSLSDEEVVPNPKAQDQSLDTRSGLCRKRSKLVRL
jgi:hypothetical protein